MTTLWDLKAVSLREKSEFGIAHFFGNFIELFIPDVADPFEEEQREM
jgi:hypothetical protein